MIHNQGADMRAGANWFLIIREEGMMMNLLSVLSPEVLSGLWLHAGLINLLQLHAAAGAEALGRPAVLAQRLRAAVPHLRCWLEANAALRPHVIQPPRLPAPKL